MKEKCISLMDSFLPLDQLDLGHLSIVKLGPNHAMTRPDVQERLTPFKNELPSTGSWKVAAWC